MSKRIRLFTLRAFVVASLTAMHLVPPAYGVPAPSTVAVEIAGLQDQLEKGLRARRPVEFEFIGKVVEMVEKDQLPLQLVISTFQWARKKAKYKEYAFPYFERALRLRAEKLGIIIS